MRLRKHEDILHKNISHKNTVQLTYDMKAIYFDINHPIPFLNERLQQNFIKLFLRYMTSSRNEAKRRRQFSLSNPLNGAFKRRKTLVPAHLIATNWEYCSISTTMSWWIRITSTVISVSPTNGNLICDPVINSSVHRFPAAGDAEAQREKEELKYSPERHGGN